MYDDITNIYGRDGFWNFKKDFFTINIKINNIYIN